MPDGMTFPIFSSHQCNFIVHIDENITDEFNIINRQKRCRN